MAHVCPWWGGYFLDNRLRRLLHKPEVILADLVQSDTTVMDFGCGMGFFSIAMARLVGHNGRVIAVDLQQKMLDVLAKRLSLIGLAERICTHRCSADSLEWDAPVDFVLAFYSVHEVPDARRLLSEIHRLLRPGGQFLVVEPMGHVTKADFQEMTAVAGEVGFGVLDRPSVRWSHAAVLVK